MQIDCFNNNLLNFQETLKELEPYGASNCRFKQHTLRRYIFSTVQGTVIEQFEEDTTVLTLVNHRIQKNPISINNRYKIITQQQLKTNSIKLVNNKGIKIANTELTPKGIFIYDNTCNRLYEQHKEKLYLDKDFNILNRYLNVNIHVANIKKRKENNKTVIKNTASYKVDALVDVIDYKIIEKELLAHVVNNEQLLAHVVNNKQLLSYNEKMPELNKVVDLIVNTKKNQLFINLVNVFNKVYKNSYNNVHVNRYLNDYKNHITSLKQIRDKHTEPYLLTIKEYNKIISSPCTKTRGITN